ncbi:hypothetical protein [Crucivirus-416]|nr:hypothetical protein [Crucivirus-416]
MVSKRGRRRTTARETFTSTLRRDHPGDVSGARELVALRNQVRRQGLTLRQIYNQQERLAGAVYETEMNSARARFYARQRREENQLNASLEAEHNDAVSRVRAGVAVINQYAAYGNANGPAVAAAVAEAQAAVGTMKDHFPVGGKHPRSDDVYGSFVPGFKPPPPRGPPPPPPGGGMGGGGGISV